MKAPTTTQPIQPLSHADARKLADVIEIAVMNARSAALGLRALPAPPLSPEELAATTPPGERTRFRDPKMPAPPTWPDPPPPRYSEAAIDAELAMILYRAAAALGLHTTGVEALLLAAGARAEAELAAERGLEIDTTSPVSMAALDGLVAAQRAALAMPSPSEEVLAERRGAKG